MDAREESRSGRDLLLDRKRRVFLPLAITLTASCGGFSVLSFLLRGLNKDVYIFAAGALVLLASTLLFAWRGDIENAGNLALLPISLLLPFSVFLPFPPHANPSSLFTLSSGGMVAMILSVLLGSRGYQIVGPAAISMAAGLLYFLVVLIPEASPGSFDIGWARSNLFASLLLEAVAMGALLFVKDLIDRALVRIDESRRGLEGKVHERTAELERLNASLREALSRLEAAQSRLVLSARLSLLGELVAGIGHEINTPLGAIMSSTRTIIEERGRILSILPEMATSFDAEERKGLARLVDAARIDPLCGGELLRRRRREAEAGLASIGYREAEEEADLLAQLGFQSVEGDLAVLAGKRLDVVRLLHAVGISRKSLEIVLEAAGRITAVTEALRDYGWTMESDEDSFIPLAKSVVAVLPLVQHSIKRGVEVRRYLDENLAVRGHAGRLGQVWLNLITNAMQAMEWKGLLSISVRGEDGQGVVSIGDDGPPISEELRERVFEPFFTTRADSGGMGLGLSIVRQIVEEHGGRVDFLSTPESTVFTVRLPLCGTSTILCED